MATDENTSRRNHRRPVIVALIALIGLAAAYAGFPRHADLTRFDPSAMAKLETSMWRHYYHKQYLPLFADLYDASRQEYGLSPLDSLRLAVAAAGAAKAFQPSTSRAEAEAALPSLVTYFGILATATPIPFEVQVAARTELAWWQARREAATPEEYGLIIAQFATLVYGIEGEELRRSGVLRAQAMAYRDAHEAHMTEADWSLIADRLELAYGLLKKALPSPADG